jgi:hypothetical protein
MSLLPKVALIAVAASPLVKTTRVPPHGKFSIALIIAPFSRQIRVTSASVALTFIARDMAAPP